MSILDAIISGNLPSVVDQLNNGASANTIGQDGLSAVHYAAMVNRLDIFQELVNHGANVHAVDYHNNTTLYFAARHMGSAEFVQYVIDAGVSIDSQNKLGQTAAIIATRLGNTDGLQTLLQNGADVSLPNIQGKTALHEAVNTDHPDEAFLLIQYGADVSTEDNFDNTPNELAQNSSNDAMQLIFNLPILSEISLIGPHHSILDAVIKGDLTQVSAALDNGQNANAMNHNGYTALHYAVLNGHTDVAELLLDHGASLIRTNFNDGQQAIHMAAMTHNADMIDVLIEHGAMINAVDELGHSPLDYASLNGGSSELIQHIIDLGAWVNTETQLAEIAPAHSEGAPLNMSDMFDLSSSQNLFSNEVHQSSVDVSRYHDNNSFAAPAEQPLAELMLNVHDIV